MTNESKELKKELISYISVYYDKKNLKEQEKMADEILKVFNTNKEFRNKVEKMAKKINDDKKIKKGGRRKTRKYQKGGNWIFIVIALLICYGIYVASQNRAANERTANSSERIERGLQDDREEKDARQQRTPVEVPAGPHTFSGRRVSATPEGSPYKKYEKTGDSRDAAALEEHQQNQAARGRMHAKGNILGRASSAPDAPTPKKLRRQKRAKSADARARMRRLAERRREAEAKKKAEAAAAAEAADDDDDDSDDDETDNKGGESKKDQGGGRKRRKTRKKQKRRK